MIVRSLVEVSTTSKKSVIVLIPIASEVYEELWKSISALGFEVLRDTYPPHITVVYLGKKYTSVEAVTEAYQRAMEAFLDWYPNIGTSKHIEITRIGMFEPTESSEGNTPIVFKVSSPMLEALNSVLVRAFMPVSDQSQFLIYARHITAGYYPGNLTMEQKKRLKQLEEIDLSLGTYMPTIQVELQHDQETIGVTNIRLS